MHQVTATVSPEGEVLDKVQHVVRVDDDGDPIAPIDMSPTDRAAIQVHYLPARRDPADQLSYAATSLLGRALRAADFTTASAAINELVTQINAVLTAHDAVNETQAVVKTAWTSLYTGEYLSDAALSFGATDVESALRLISLTFTPSPGGGSLSCRD